MATPRSGYPANVQSMNVRGARVEPPTPGKSQRLCIPPSHCDSAMHSYASIKDSFARSREGFKHRKALFDVLLLPSFNESELP
jgi:hypothetical protein